MREKKSDIEKKAFKVMEASLRSDDEKEKLLAVKAFYKKGDNKFNEPLDNLLDSDASNIRIQAAKTILCKSENDEDEEEAKIIISPFDEWEKKNIRNNAGSEDDSFKDHWFALTGYTPHPAQTAVHASDGRFIVCICGRRFGKSLLAAKEAEAILMRPNKRVWIVAPTYVLTDKVFREIYKTLVVEKKLDPRAIIKKSESERIIKLAWGSEVVGKSAENPDSLLGESVDYLIFDECAKVKKRVWEKYLRPTLTDRNGRALFITTPEGTNWLYRLYKRGMSKHAKSADWRGFLFPTSSNPHISASDIEEARSTLAQEVFNQEYLADFYSFTGKVYKEFLHDTHVR